MESRILPFLIIALIFFSTAKGQINTNIKIEKGDCVIASLNRAKENGIKIEGKFIKIISVQKGHNDLYLKVADSIMVFNSPLWLDTTEIDLLKDTGNNIRLTYIEYGNPVTKQNDKLVQYMEPVYKFEKED